MCCNCKINADRPILVNSRFRQILGQDCFCIAGRVFIFILHINIFSLFPWLFPVLLFSWNAYPFRRFEDSDFIWRFGVSNFVNKVPFREFIIIRIFNVQFSIKLIQQLVRIFTFNASFNRRCLDIECMMLWFLNVVFRF